jgi:hypothetical protein
MNTICLGSGSAHYIKVFVAVCSAALMLSCETGTKARQWYPADSVTVVATSDTTPLWRFDADTFLSERLSILSTDASGPSAERMLREFRKVINGWVTDSLAESFWNHVNREFGMRDIALAVEIGHPDDDAVYICRAIVETEKGPLLARTRRITAIHGSLLEYSWLPEREYEDIMRRLSEEFGVFQLKSDFHLGAENPPMTVVEACYGGRYNMALFSFYHKPSSARARAMFEYLDSLFWGQ